MLLHMKSSTPSFMVYGELGRYPLGIDIKIRMVSYWEAFIDGKQSKLSNILYKLCLALSNIEGKNFIWLFSVKGILNECDLAYIWNTQTFQNTEWLKLNIKQTLRDQFSIQFLLSLIQNSPKALNYRTFKEQFETENYLHILDDNFLFEFCKFRTLNYKLPIEYGRWHNIARNMHFVIYVIKTKLGMNATTFCNANV